MRILVALCMSCVLCSSMQGENSFLVSKSYRAKKPKQEQPIVVSQWVQAFVPSYAHISLSTTEDVVPVCVGAVPCNQQGSIANNINYDADSQVFTIEEPGVYVIDYFVKTMDKTPSIPNDSALTVGVKVNGEDKGIACVASSYVDTDLFVSQANRQILCDLDVGDTVSFHVLSTFSEAVESYFAGSEMTAFISLRKIT